jgi:hypothetical protein
LPRDLANGRSAVVERSRRIRADLPPTDRNLNQSILRVKCMFMVSCVCCRYHANRMLSFYAPGEPLPFLNSNKPA